MFFSHATAFLVVARDAARVGVVVRPVFESLERDLGHAVAVLAQHRGDGAALFDPCRPSAGRDSGNQCQSWAVHLACAAWAVRQHVLLELLRRVLVQVHVRIRVVAEWEAARAPDPQDLFTLGVRPRVLRPSAL